MKWFIFKIRAYLHWRLRQLSDWVAPEPMKSFGKYIKEIEEYGEITSLNRPK